MKMTAFSINMFAFTFCATCAAVCFTSNSIVSGTFVASLAVPNLLLAANTLFCWTTK